MNKLKMLIGLLFAATAVTAQTNFSGTWVQKNKEFISGPKYANAVPEQVKLTPKKDSIAFEVISIAQNNSTDTAHYTLATNGGLFSDISKSKRKYTKKLQLSADKKTMTVTSIYKSAENDTEVEITRTETWSLSADGKQLTLNRKSDETKSESWEAKGTYEKK